MYEGRWYYPLLKPRFFNINAFISKPRRKKNLSPYGNNKSKTILKHSFLTWLKGSYNWSSIYFHFFSLVEEVLFICVVFFIFHSFIHYYHFLFFRMSIFPCKNFIESFLWRKFFSSKGYSIVYTIMAVFGVIRFGLLIVEREIERQWKKKSKTMCKKKRNTQQRLEY